jgi:DNA mismatch endonuclease (patch repair protein)
MDIVSPQHRSLMMSRIQGKDTKPELSVRKVAHQLGYRFRLHRRDLPGTPDLVFPGRKKIVFVHGCFWHRHAGCRLAYVPKSNAAFWGLKFESNIRRDVIARTRLTELGWEVRVIWECETKNSDTLAQLLKEFLDG